MHQYISVGMTVGLATALLFIGFSCVMHDFDLDCSPASEDENIWEDYTPNYDDDSDDDTNEIIDDDVDWDDDTGDELDAPVYLEAIAGGIPGLHNSAVIKGDRSIYVASEKSRVIKIYKILDDGLHDVEKVADPARQPSLAIDWEGRLALAYYDALGSRLIYAVKDEDVWIYQIADEQETAVGGYPSLAIDDNGMIHILHCRLDENENCIQLLRTIGTAGEWYTTEVAPTQTPGKLVVDNIGLERIAYYDSAVKVVQPGMEGWEVVFSDDSSLAPVDLSLAVDSNRALHLAYNIVSDEEGHSALWYANNIEGEWKSERIAGSDTSNLGWDNSISVNANGKVQIAYFNEDSQALWFATNQPGQWANIPIDGYNEGDRIGLNTAILTVDNLWAFIVYLDETNGWLKRASNMNFGWRDYIVDYSDYVSTPNLADYAEDGLYLSYFYGTYPGLVYSVRRGGQWIIEDIIADVDEAPASVRLAMDDSGVAQAIYSLDEPTGVSLYYATNYHDAWENELLPVDVGGSDHDLAIDPEGTAYIATYDTQEQALVMLDNYLGEWTTEKVCSFVAAEVGARLALDAQGNVHIVVYSSKGDDVHELRYATNRSGDWTWEIIATSEEPFAADIAVDDEGLVHLTYNDPQTGLWSLVGDDEGWVDESIAAQSMVVSSLALLLDAIGDEMLTFTDSLNGDIWYGQNLTGLWQTVLIDFSGDVGAGGSLAMTPDNVVHLVYGGEDTIWCASFANSYGANRE